jgi:hypothetical protein
MHSIDKNCSTISLLPQPTHPRWGHHASCNHANNTGGNISSWFLLHRRWHSDASNYRAARRASAASAKLWNPSSLVAGIAYICDRTKLEKLWEQEGTPVRSVSTCEILRVWWLASLIFVIAPNSRNYGSRKARQCGQCQPVKPFKYDGWHHTSFCGRI